MAKQFIMQDKREMTINISVINSFIWASLEDIVKSIYNEMGIEEYNRICFDDDTIDYISREIQLTILNNKPDNYDISFGFTE